MSRLLLPAYAKINLFLEIGSRREDGYHNIETVMHTVSLHDDVSVETNNTGEVTIDCPSLDIPPEANIAWRAARLYLDTCEIGDGVHITLNKNIPWEAGLGGGSADAGAVLRALDSIYARFGRIKLCSLAAKLGSDVPFCVRGGCMLARGKGELLSPLPFLPDCFIVIARGNTGTSTAEAYRAADALSYDLRENKLAEAMGTYDLGTICREVFNRFEDTSDYCGDIKQILSSGGALCSCLSGSGSAVYGIFDNEGPAAAARGALAQAGYWTSFCIPNGG